MGQSRHFECYLGTTASPQIVLQKSQIAVRQFSRKKTKQAAIVD
jgi:hypothetical protein